MKAPGGRGGGSSGGCQSHKDQTAPGQSYGSLLRGRGHAGMIEIEVEM